jgi:hypothetical protein
MNMWCSESRDWPSVRVDCVRRGSGKLTKPDSSRSGQDMIVNSTYCATAVNKTVLENLQQQGYNG